MSRRRGHLVCIIGTDGSGKTTLAKAVTAELRKRGVNARYVWGSIEPFLMHWVRKLGKKLFLSRTNEFEDYRDYSRRKKAASRRHPLLSRLYCNLILWDYYLRVLCRIRVPLLLGMTVVSDRYYHDVGVYFSVDLEYSPERMERLIKRLSRLFPKPSLIYLLDVREEVSFERKDDIPSIRYLEERRGLYLDMARILEMEILSGESPVHLLAAKVVGDLLSFAAERS